MLLGKVFEFLQTGISCQWVDIGSVKIINPLDALQPGPGCQFELICPQFTRETLDAVVGRGNHATLHDAYMCHSISVCSVDKFSHWISF